MGGTTQQVLPWLLEVPRGIESQLPTASTIAALLIDPLAFLVSLSHSCFGASWDHLPNKLLALKSLTLDLLLGKLNRKH